MDEAVRAVTFGTERIEDGQGPFDIVGLAAGHQAVAVLQAPDAAGNTAVSEPDAFIRQDGAMFLVLGKRELPPSITRSPASSLVPSSVITASVISPDGNHDPDQARRGDGRNEFIHAGNIGDVRVTVESGYLDAAIAQPFAHVETHFAKAD